MAVLSGTHITHPLGIFFPGAVTSDLNTTDMRWVPGASIMGKPAAGAVTRTLAGAFSRSIAAAKVRSYSDDFYHRIHIFPASLDLGNVASAQVSTVYVWNAHLVAQQLTDIESIDAEGISVDGQSAPFLAAPLRVLSYLVAVTPDGPPVVNAKIIWHFTSADAALPITATRIIPFGFVPDWGDGIMERLSWLTAILSPPTGSEQRRALRLSPRRIFDAPVIIENQERQYFDMSLWGWGARVWALPIWHDVQLLTAPVALGALSVSCATSDREFRAGGLALLRGDTASGAEVVEIDTVGVAALTLKRPTQQAWSQGARLYPSRTAQLAVMPELTRLHDRASAAAVSFQLMEPSDWPALAPATTYRTYPVLEQRPDESEDLMSSMQRLLRELDNSTGLPTRTDLGRQAFTVQSHRWLLGNRAEHAAFRSLLYFLQGRYKAVWVPTFADDLTLAASVGSTSTSIAINMIGYTRFAGTAPGRRDIRVELRDGTVFHRRITGSSELTASTETLAIDTAFGRVVNPSDVSRISWLALCRLDQDDIELQHETDAAGISKCQVIFRSVRDEL